MLRRTVLLIAITAAAVLSSCGSTGGGGGDNFFDCGGDKYTPNPPKTNGTPVGTAIPEDGHQHATYPQKVKFNHDPPTSGCHYSIPQQAPLPAGVYDKQLDAEFWVHNLEHGYVIALYNCPSGCPTDFDALKKWATGLPPDPKFSGGYAKVLVLPWTSMKDKFAMVSWDWYLGMSDKLDIKQVQAFYDNHIDQSPEGNSLG